MHLLFDFVTSFYCLMLYVYFQHVVLPCKLLAKKQKKSHFTQFFESVQQNVFVLRLLYSTYLLHRFNFFLAEIPAITVSRAADEVDTAVEGGSAECMGPPAVAGTSTETSQALEQSEDMLEGEDGVSTNMKLLSITGSYVLLNYPYNYLNISMNIMLFKGVWYIFLTIVVHYVAPALE